MRRPRTGASAADTPAAFRRRTGGHATDQWDGEVALTMGETFERSGGGGDDGCGACATALAGVGGEKGDVRRGCGVVVCVVGVEECGETEGVEFVDGVVCAVEGAGDGRGIGVRDRWAGFGFGEADGIADGVLARCWCALLLMLLLLAGSGSGVVLRKRREGWEIVDGERRVA